MPKDLQIGESRDAVMDERFNGKDAEAEYVVDCLRRRNFDKMDPQRGPNRIPRLHSGG